MFIRNVNDKAALAYQPKPYPGKITLFRPKKSYVDFNDPHYGWDGLIMGTLEIHELRVRLSGMLQEPNVQHLADVLKICIHDTK